MAGVEKLPVQDIDDQSLIYPTPTKQADAIVRPWTVGLRNGIGP
ncbi:hypothetical protein [Bradyrhizobium sp. USDA 10063]